MSAVYLIGCFEVEDWDTYNEYVQAGFSTVAEDVETLVVNDTPTLLEGEWFGPRTVVMKFPSREAAETWYHGDGYQQAAKLRHAAAKSNLILVDEYVPEL
jgi:uncharacterized protein (DUF1330 family)